MNLSPQQVDAMSMWHFFAIVEAMSEDGKGELTAAEADDLWDWLKSKETALGH